MIEAPRGGGVASFIALIGIVALVGFLFVENNLPSPMLSLELFRSRNFSGANLITFFLYAENVVMDYEDVSEFYLYLAECLESGLRDQFWQIMEGPYPG